MTHRRLLVTDTLLPSLRLAAVLSGDRRPGGPTVLATFSRGRSPAAALVSRLGIAQRSLADWHAPTPEEALLGACQASGASEVVMWACPRGAAALHALRHLDARPQITYLFPRMGTSPWDESEAIAIRAGNLIDRFVVDDAATAGRLADIGVSASRIVLHGPPDLPARQVPKPARLLLIAGLDDDVRQLTREWCGGIGLAVSEAGIAAIVGVALGLGGRPGHMILSERVVEAAAPLIQAAQHGWGATVVSAGSGATALQGPLAPVTSEGLAAHLEAIA